MIYIQLDNENYIIKFCVRPFIGCIALSTYPENVKLFPTDYKLINNELVYSPRETLD